MVSHTARLLQRKRGRIYLRRMRIDIGEWHLRPYRDSDLHALVKYADNPNVARNLRDRFPHPYTAEAGRAWIAAAGAQADSPEGLIRCPAARMHGVRVEVATAG